MSVLPETTVGVAKLTVELAPLSPRTVTWTVGFMVRAMPLTVVFRVLAVPAVVAVKMAVYMPGVVVVTVPKARGCAAGQGKAESVPLRPLIGLPAPSLTTIVIRSVLPEATVGDAKLAVEWSR